MRSRTATLAAAPASSVPRRQPRPLCAGSRATKPPVLEPVAPVFGRIPTRRQTAPTAKISRPASVAADNPQPAVL